ncbi:MAG: hypothetical protein IJ142_02815, partial [Bacteroidaceae bacterium]|nr:hypothetical protein [Bacteroidaceae bacterium]
MHAKQNFKNLPRRTNQTLTSPLHAKQNFKNLANLANFVNLCKRPSPSSCPYNHLQMFIRTTQVSQVNNALKGQQYVSPGHRPGYANKCDFRPVRAKDLYLMTILLPLQGVYMAVICYPGRCPGLT